MNPKTTAIVLIEYQNDFTTPGGVFHDGVKDVMQSNNMLANFKVDAGPNNIGVDVVPFARQIDRGIIAPDATLRGRASDHRDTECKACKYRYEASDSHRSLPFRTIGGVANVRYGLPLLSARCLLRSSCALSALSRM